MAGGTSAAAQTSRRPHDSPVWGLTVEHRTDPLGVDADRPRFGWRTRSATRGWRQGAYQILVASSPDRLTATRADVWNSGRVRSSDSVAVRYAGKSLRASTRCHWTVSVWDAEGRLAGTASPAVFETGLMSTDGVTGWDGARWIGMKGKTPNSAGAPMLRKEETLKVDNHRQVRDARLYISALGVYEAHVNGHRVTVEQDGDRTIELLPPGWTNYDTRVDYMTYDVTDLVPRGSGVTLAVVLGNGWYNGRVSDGSTYYAKDGNALAVKAKLLIRYADGTAQTVVTGTESGWKATDTGPYRADDIYDGQTYDARMELPGWTSHGFDDTAWSDVERIAFEDTYPDVRLLAYPGETARFVDHWDRRPQSVTVATGVTGQDGSPNGRGRIVVDPARTVTDPAKAATASVTIGSGDTAVFDLGQNMVGVARYTVRGPGRRQGRVQVRRDPQRRQRRRRRRRGFRLPGQPPQRRGHQHVHPHGRPEGGDPSGLPDLLRLPPCVRHGVGDRHDHAADGQGRHLRRPRGRERHDERSPCQQAGEQHPMGAARQLPLGTHRLPAARRTPRLDRRHPGLRHDRPLQRGRRRLPQPFPGHRRGLPDHLRSGPGAVHRRRARRSLQLPRRWQRVGGLRCRPALDRVADDRRPDRRRAQLAVDGPLPRLDPGADRRHLRRPGIPHRRLARPAEDQRPADERRLLRLLRPVDGTDGPCDRPWRGGGDLRAALRTYQAGVHHQVPEHRGRPCHRPVQPGEASPIEPGSDPNQRTEDNSQSALLWVLKLGFYETEAQRRTLVGLLADNIGNDAAYKEAHPDSIRVRYAENTLSVGFLGVNVLAPVLTDEGRADLAYELLHRDALPSWLFSVKNGATTVWERWNSYSEDAGFGPVGMNSFNHYAYGAIMEWMYAYMAGIARDPDGPGFKRFVLQPHLDPTGRITRVSGTYASPYGEIRSAWEVGGGGRTLTYEAVVPANSEATLRVPAASADSVREGRTPLARVDGVRLLGHAAGVSSYHLPSGRYRLTADLR